MHSRPHAWSAYVDESWRGRPIGSKPVQRRTRQVLGPVGLDVRTTPASNVVFVRSGRAADLGARKADLLGACWPVHDGVIHALGVRVIVCMGGDAGGWVRERVAAHSLRGYFVERNARRWRSTWHSNGAGISVLTLTHPAVADWISPEADPSELVRAALESRD